MERLILLYWHDDDNLESWEHMAPCASFPMEFEEEIGNALFDKLEIKFNKRINKAITTILSPSRSQIRDAFGIWIFGHVKSWLWCPFTFSDMIPCSVFYNKITVASSNIQCTS